MTISDKVRQGLELTEQERKEIAWNCAGNIQEVDTKEGISETDFRSSYIVFTIDNNPQLYKLDYCLSILKDQEPWYYADPYPVTKHVEIIQVEQVIYRETK